MSMHGGVPVVTTIKGRREFAGRRHIGVAVQGMADLVGILLVNAGQGKLRESIGSFDVEVGSASSGKGRCSKQGTDDAKHELHAGNLRTQAMNLAITSAAVRD